MATRINKKFVFILAVTVFAVAGLAGGMWYLQRRGDTTRHIKAGDEFVAAREYERAFKMYGRAVGKEPAQLSHLDKMEKALLLVRPRTRDHAAELDDMRMSIFAHRTRYRPRDPEIHMALLTELHAVARFIDQAHLWQRLADAADDMWERVPPEESKRVYAKLYRGMANMRLITPGAATEDQIAESERDLVAFVAAVPDDDLGWAALVASRLSIAHQLRLGGRTRRAAAKFAEVDQTLGEALSAVPEGPEV